MTDESNADADTGAADDTGAEDTGAGTGADNSGDDSAGDSGESGKSGDSLLDHLDGDEGTAFDFTTGERPDDFPEELWDADGKAPDPQKMYDAYKKQEKRADDLRSKLGKGDHKAPKTPGEYKLEFSEEVAALVPDDDPLVQAGKEIAHKYGMGQESFAGFMAEMTEKMLDVAQNPPEMSPEQQKAYAKEQIDKIGPNGAQVLRSVQSWGKSLEAEGTLTPADVQTLEQEMLTSPESVKVLNRLRARMGGNDVPTDIIDDGLPSDAVIADQLDKAYEAKDPGKIKEAEEMLNKRRKAGRPERLVF